MFIACTRCCTDHASTDHAPDDASPHDELMHDPMHHPPEHDPMHQPNMGPPRGGCNEGIPYILEETPPIPAPHLEGYPQNRGPKTGPRIHSNIGAPDGRQCDLAHISCSGEAQNRVPGTPIWDPLLSRVWAAHGPFERTRACIWAQSRPGGASEWAPR